MWFHTRQHQYLEFSMFRTALTSRRPQAKCRQEVPARSAGGKRRTASGQPAVSRPQGLRQTAGSEKSLASGSGAMSLS